MAKKKLKKRQMLEVKSPVVGKVYLTPNRNEPPFVKIGSHVDPETIVCIVEALKTPLNVKAGVSGKIVKIVATDDGDVEYEGALFRIKPD